MLTKILAAGAILLLGYDWLPCSRVGAKTRFRAAGSEWLLLSCSALRRRGERERYSGSGIEKIIAAAKDIRDW